MKISLIIISLLLTSAANARLNIFSVDSTGSVHRLEHEFNYEAEFKQDHVAAV